MALLCLNHSQGYVKPTYPGQVQPRLALAAGTRLSRLPCITRVRRGRPVGLPCAAQRQNIVEGGLPQQNNSPATTIISYAKLLTLTGVMAAAMLLDRKPAYAVAVPRPETVHNAVDSTSSGKKGVWQRVKATATASVGALDRLLFPDEAITFIGSNTASAVEPQAASSGPAPSAPVATGVLSYELTHVITSDDSAGLTTDAESPGQRGAAAMTAALLPSSRQLTAAVSAVGDRLAGSLAQITEAVTPGWPAESVALGAVSRLPAELSAPFSAADARDASAAAAVDDVEDVAPAALSAEMARQLVRGGYALAGLVVAVMAWQLAACVAVANEPTQAKRAPLDNAWDPQQTHTPPDTTAGTTSTPAAAAAAAVGAAVVKQQQELPVIQLGPDNTLAEALKGKNVVGPFCLKPQLQQRLPPGVTDLQSSDSLPAALQGKKVVGPFCLKPQPQQQQRPVVELCPEDDLPPDLQGKAVVGPLCLLHPSLGPASHGHFSVAAVAAAAATAEALAAEAHGMRQAAAEVVAESDKPLTLMTVEDAAQMGEQVMQSALAAAAAADSSSAAASQHQQKKEAEGDPDAPAVSVQLSEVATAPDDEPLFRVHLTVTKGSATDSGAAAAVSDSLEGRLAAEVVREALVAESCAAAAAAAAERAQIATHLIEDAIAAHSSSTCTDVHSVDAGAAGTASRSSSVGGEDSSQGEGLMTVSWEEVECSMAAEVREAEVAAAMAPAAAAAAEAAAAQEISISWQEPAAAAAPDAAAAKASSAAQCIPASWQKQAVADPVPVSAKEAIPVVWEKLAGSSTVAVASAAASAAAAAPAAAAAQEISVSWQQPQAAAADTDKALCDVSSAAVQGAKLEELAAEAKVAETAAAEAEAARAAAAAAVARVAAARASLCQQEAQQRLVQEAKAAEAAAAEAEAARATAAAAVARVAAAKAAAPATASDASDRAAEGSDTLAAADIEDVVQEAKAAEAAAAEAEVARTAAAAAVVRVASAKILASAADVTNSAAAATAVESDTSAAAETEKLVPEAKEAEAAAAEAEAARAATAAALARMAATKTALVRSATESVAAAVSTDAPSNAVTAESQQEATKPTQDLDAAAAAAASRAAQAELIAEAIAAEAAAIAADAAAGAADSAAAAEGSAGDAAQLVKGWLSSSTTGPTQQAVTTPNNSSYSKSSSSRIVSGPPVSVSWLLDDADEPEVLSQLTQLAASLGRPAIGPISSSSTAAVSEVDAVTSEGDADAFKDEFAVPNDEEPTAAASELATNAKQQQQAATLADVLDAASRAQMQAASETARRQAHARVVALYRTRRTAAPASRDSASGSTPTAQKTLAASVPPASADRAATAAGGGSKEASGGRTSLQQQLACQLGVSDVALAMALAAFEGTEPASPKGPTSIDSSGAGRAGVTVLNSSSNSNPYASTAEAINASNDSKAVFANAAGSSRDSSKRIDVVFGTLEEESDTFEVAVQRMVLNSARPGKRNSSASAGTAAPAAADGKLAAGGDKDSSSSKRIAVVFETLEEESDSFEVAVQRMVLNSARPGKRNVKSSSSSSTKPAAAPADGSRLTAPSAKVSGIGSNCSSTTDVVDAPGKGEVLVLVEEGADSSEMAVKRAARAERTTPSTGTGKDSTACSEAPAAAAAAVAAGKERSSGSKAAAVAKTDEGVVSSSKGAAVAQGGVRIQIKQANGKAGSFEVAVQRMVSSTASKTSSRCNNSGSDSDSSSERSRSPSGPKKGFGRVVRAPVKLQQQQQQQRNRPTTLGGSARVPLYKASSGPAGALRPLPWWEQRAAARRTGNNWSDWEGFKAPDSSSTAAAEDTVTPETSTAAAVAVADPAAPSPAASAAAAPTSIPVEWMTTPTQQKRSELKQRAAAILKQQQQGYGGDAIAAAAAAAAVSTKGSSKVGPAALPVGWGSKAGAASKKPRGWAAVAPELTQELECEMSNLLGSAPAAAQVGSKDLSAPFATPKIAMSGTAPTKTQQLLQKQRLGQQKQVQQGVKGTKPQVGRQAPLGFGSQQGSKSSKA